jgi:molecular chaperone DnaJ
VTHYESLGVSRTATAAELREAFRRAARAAHPDRHGDASAARMAAINEAWHVLGDPDRRRRYDADLAAAERPSSSGASATMRADGSDANPPAHEPYRFDHHEPARFPFRFMAALASLGVALVLVGVIVYDPPAPVAPDGILHPGDCVALSEGFEASEVSCTGEYDAVVDQLVAFDAVCPADTEAFRDRQGLGIACVVRSLP